MMSGELLNFNYGKPGQVQVFALYLPVGIFGIVAVWR
jgi:hypothetical protein